MFQFLLLSPESFLGIGKFRSFSTQITLGGTVVKEGEKASFKPNSGLDKSSSYVKITEDNL
tara:strand:- start:25533 stop:25715 length:183 start_codon:yes stop_codon:yes gene_type:complete